MAAEEQAGPVAERAAELLEQLRQMLEAGGEFVAEQAPPLAAEIVARGRVLHTASLCASLIVIAALWAVARAIARQEKDPSPYGVAGMVTLFLGLWPAFAFEMASKVWFAPRLYVLECIKGLL